MFLGLAAGLWSCQKRSRGSLSPAVVGAGPGAPRVARGRRRRASRTPQNVSVCLKVAFLCFKIFLFLCACVSKPSTTSENSCPSHFAVEGADPQQLPRLVVLSPVLPARAAGAHSLFSHPCAVPRWLGCCSRASGGLGSGSPPPACEVLAGETFLEPPDCNPRGLVAENERRKRCLAPSNNSPTRVRAALSRH